MADRWANQFGKSVLSRDGTPIGVVMRSITQAGMWYGTAFSAGADFRTTRAAAMRAVAGRTDPKKGYFTA